MTNMFFSKGAISLVVLCSLAPWADAQKTDASLQRLMRGNQHFVAGAHVGPHRSSSRRKEIAPKQKPFAVVVCCSDSRVPPELVFDQGLGDLFVVRVAGNVVDDVALGSIEYAVEHLGVKFIFVLGHESCGAVAAALQGGSHDGHLESFLKMIEPAVEAIKGKPGNALDNAIKENVRLVVKDIKTSDPVLSKSFANHHLGIAGGYYDLHTGRVSLVK